MVVEHYSLLRPASEGKLSFTLNFYSSIQFHKLLSLLPALGIAARKRCGKARFKMKFAARIVPL
jgi:hypothetical protein